MRWLLTLVLGNSQELSQKRWHSSITFRLRDGPRPTLPASVEDEIRRKEGREKSLGTTI